MIRQLVPEDAAAMARLHASSFDPAWPESDMHGHINSDLVVGYGDPLAAFVILRLSADQGEILTLVTDPDHRGQGLAGQVLSEAEKHAAQQGVDILFLEVAEDNDPARALYKKLGYERIGRRPAYYRRKNGRVAALTFRKKLDASNP